MCFTFKKNKKDAKQLAMSKIIFIFPCEKVIWFYFLFLCKVILFLKIFITRRACYSYDVGVLYTLTLPFGIIENKQICKEFEPDNNMICNNVFS